MSIDERKKAVEQLEKAVSALKTDDPHDLVLAMRALGLAAEHIAEAIHWERFEAGLDRGVNLMWGKK